MKGIIRGAALAAAALVVLLPASAAGVTPGGEKFVGRRVRFKPGRQTAVVWGSLRPSLVHRYFVRGREGQSLKVRVRSTDETVRFDVNAVGSFEHWQLSGEGGVRSWGGRLPAAAEHAISVYADNGCNYSIEIELR